MSRRILTNLQFLELCEVAVDAMTHKDKIIRRGLGIGTCEATVYAGISMNTVLYQGVFGDTCLRIAWIIVGKTFFDTT